MTGKKKKIPIRIPVPKPGFPHSTKKGLRGYDRKKENKAVKKETDDYLPEE